MRRPVGLHDRPYRFGALDDRGSSLRHLAGLGLVVAWQVEGDDPVAGLDERLDEHREVRAATAPPVDQEHRRPGTPRLACDPVTIPERLHGLPR
jgi:hypothetical protein